MVRRRSFRDPMSKTGSVRPLASMVLIWRLCPWRPSVGFLTAQFREMVGYGRFIVGADLADMGLRYADFILIGHLLGAGPVTTLPLLWFASAARRLRLTSLGFFQYLAPSLSFLLAVLVFREPFVRSQAMAFGCIWLALAVYSGDALRGPRTAPPPGR